MPRQPRAEAIQQERRRRRPDTLDRVHDLKLAIPAEFRDDKDYEYRWINDVNDRVYSLTQEDDWDLCTRSDPEATDDNKYRRQVDTTKNGHPVYAYLVRKPKDWYDADKRAKAERLSKAEQALLKSPPTDNPQAAQTMYVPGGSSIRRGAYAP